MLQHPVLDRANRTHSVLFCEVLVNPTCTLVASQWSDCSRTWTSKGEAICWRTVAVVIALWIWRPIMSFCIVKSTQEFNSCQECDLNPDLQAWSWGIVLKPNQKMISFLVFCCCLPKNFFVVAFHQLWSGLVDLPRHKPCFQIMNLGMSLESVPEFHSSLFNSHVDQEDSVILLCKLSSGRAKLLAGSCAGSDWLLEWVSCIETSTTSSTNIWTSNV